MMQMFRIVLLLGVLFFQDVGSFQPVGRTRSSLLVNDGATRRAVRFGSNRIVPSRIRMAQDASSSAVLNLTDVVVSSQEPLTLAPLDDPAIMVPSEGEAALFAPSNEEEVPTTTSIKSINVDEPSTTSTPIQPPSVKNILRFAVPAICVWLCSPLLSLIDTSAVGILSGTAQQAALAPAVAVTDYGALLLAFLYTGTTNLMASSPSDKQSSTLMGALQLAAWVGAGFGVVFGITSRKLVQTITGTDAIDPVVFATALRYCRIRALGMPAAAVIGSAQAACLGVKDMRSPLYVLLAAALVNFCGDMVLVPMKNLLVGGAAGAAWATVASQYMALAMFLAWLKWKPAQAHDDKRKSGGSLVTRGMLAGKFRARDLFKFPRKSVAKQFSPYVLSVSSMSIGRISGYIAMSHVASSTLGIQEMAAQQILFSFFCCFIPVCESLNLTAQSFVPAIFASASGKARTDVLKQTIVNFLKAGGYVGAALVAVMACIPLLSRFFTLDPAVISSVNSATPIMALIFCLFGMVNSGEGLLLGQKDLNFLGKSYAVWFFAVPYVMLQLKKVAASGVSVGVASMWKVFSLYQIVRLTTWLLRLRQLHARRRAQDALQTQ